VAVPIGNKEDITLRALRTLQSADIIACEDTRTTGKLLAMYNIVAQKMIRCDEHTEMARAEDVLQYIREGKSVVYVSDAGTPAISDPGSHLVKEAAENDISIVPIPGASAVLLAVTVSGLDTSSFTFMGFPPHKKGRQTFLETVLACKETCILYESPFRIIKLLEQLEKLEAGGRKVAVVRELTKLHEEHLRGTVSEVKDILLARSSQKGEFAIVIEGVSAFTRRTNTV
jgi:16S rRNA (cytidine1402-2'-O)-methyltransferase